MHKAALRLILVLGLSAILWGIHDVADTPADHATTYVGLAKIGAGAVLATLAIGFNGLLLAIDKQPSQRTPVAPSLLPEWVPRSKK